MGCPVWSLCQIAAVSARIRHKTRADTPSGLLSPCQESGAVPTAVTMRHGHFAGPG